MIIFSILLIYVIITCLVGDDMLERIIPFAHSKVKEHINIDDIVVDMTAGNGNDTLFLASLCKHVYSFDIQANAISNTKNILSRNGLDNVTLIQDSHVYVSKYVKDQISCAIFNLGYLPRGDKSITTKGESTLKALDNLFPLLKPNGLVSITVYVGHPEGNKESELLEEYVSALPSNKFNVLLYKNLNKKNAPYNIFIEKIGE